MIECLLERIDTRHLFRPLADELLHLLHRLTHEQWVAPTSAGTWTVGDVVAHLLDGDLRRISAQRDQHVGPSPAVPIIDYESLMRHLTELNSTWVAASERLSTTVLTDLLAASSLAASEVLGHADLDAPALFPVAWAGQQASPMWLDVAREYTERWHHQDQIREATGVAPLQHPQWLAPVIRTSLLALPFRYDNAAVPSDAVIGINIEGNSGSTWHLRHSGSWRLYRGGAAHRTCLITIGDLELARLLLHRLAPGAVQDAIRIEGPEILAAPLIDARAVMV